MNFKFWIEADEKWQRFGHQKTFPFLREPENPFFKNAEFFLGKDIEDFGLKHSQYAPEKMYHVTTNLPAIKSSNELKSRSQLKTQEIGLGGGPSNMAPNMVSLTYSYQKAKEIYDGLVFVSNIVNGNVLASDIYDYAASQNDHHNYLDEDQLSNFEQVLINYVPEKIVIDGDETKIKIYLNNKIKTPKEKYNFLQELESAIVEDNPIPDYSDNMEFDKVVDFTAPFDKIKFLKKENIAIIQVVVRKNANTHHYSQEAELRVLPQDIAILKYFQP